MKMRVIGGDAVAIVHSSAPSAVVTTSVRRLLQSGAIAPRIVSSTALPE